MLRFLAASLRALAETGALLGGPALSDLQLARPADRGLRLR